MHDPSVALCWYRRVEPRVHVVDAGDVGGVLRVVLRVPTAELTGDVPLGAAESPEADRRWEHVVQCCEADRQLFARDRAG